MANRDELTRRVNDLDKQIQSFVATVDITPSTGSVYKGQITEYKDVRGFILFRRPEDMRIIAQYPVVRSTAFDMVSDGKIFKTYLPSKNLFVIGENAAPANSPNKLENLRPQAFLEAMMIRPVDPAKEQVMLIDDTDEDHAVYILVIFGNDATGNAIPLRSIWFDRLDLQIIRQEIYAPNSNILSDTRYANWTDYSGVNFPASIDINRPIDGYGIVLKIVNMKMNTPVTDQQFALTQPPGSKLQVIGSPPGVPAAGPLKSQK